MPRALLGVRQLRVAAEKLGKELLNEKDLPKEEQIGSYVRAIEILVDLYKISEQEAEGYAPRIMEAAELFMRPAAQGQ